MKSLLIIYKSVAPLRLIVLILMYKTGSLLRKGGLMMKLRKISAAFIASTVLVMPLGSFMAASAYGDAEVVFSNENHLAVIQGDVVFPTFTPDEDIEVYSISTYHQNESEGTIVNTISVYDDEELIGMWEAVNLSGKYDVPEEEWFCYPRGLVLEAGHTYKFVDSDPDTWSYNTESDGCGFIKITTGSETIKGLTPEASRMGGKVEFNGHTYQRIDAPSEWEEAKYYCERHGGYLATITSAEEQAAIEELLQGGTMDVYWLGGTAYDCTLEWITGEDTSYTNWAAGQPDNAFDGYHVEIQNKEMEYLPIYKWGDTDEASEFFGLDKTGFICEWGEVDSSEGLKGSLRWRNTRNSYLWSTAAKSRTPARC